jgi:hypothetical protein
MLNVAQIKSFREIPIVNKKTLIICDIDDTVLKMELNYSHFLKVASRDLSGCNINIIRENAMAKFVAYRNKTNPIATDLSGFRDMLRRLYLNFESDLVFLTARSAESNHLTRKHLFNIGIEPCYKIYFTGNQISKGEYIIDNIPWLSYEKVIFIDDMPMNILSVTICSCI